MSKIIDVLAKDDAFEALLVTGIVAVGLVTLVLICKAVSLMGMM